jgi:hypothetical protein
MGLMWLGIPNATSAATRVPRHLFWYAFGAIAAIFGVGLSFVAWSSVSAKLGVGGVVLMLSAPGIAVLGTPGRRECETTEPPPSPELMGRRLRQAELGLTIIRGARAVVMIATSFLAILWFCETGNLNSAGGFLLPYTFLCLGALATYLPWLGRREQRLIALSETRRMQLEAFKRSRGWFPD